MAEEPQEPAGPKYRQVQTLMPESGGGGYGGFSVGYTTVNNLDALAMGIRGDGLSDMDSALGLAVRVLPVTSPRWNGLLRPFRGLRRIVH